MPAPGTDHPADAPLRLVFDGYLDPTSDFDRAVQLSSAGVPFDVQVAYDPTGPALVVRPPVALRPGLGYQLVLSAAELRGLDGRVPAEDLVVGFIARPARGEPLSQPVDFERELAPVLAARCSCHGDEPLAYPPLVPERLIDQPSRADPDRRLVVPGDALASELVLKLLPDYPAIHGLSMPPEGPPLAPAVVRRVIDWVEGL